MQRPVLKLREIIYEITSYCQNGCEYCGSKEYRDIETDENHIKRIIDAIADYPPEAIDVSGGDPLEVSYDTHKYLVAEMNSRGVCCKILVNPLSFKRNEYNNITDLYSVVGCSINNEAELAAAEMVKKIEKTIITNFNMSNIFMFDAICQYVEHRSLVWQIQHTMYRDKDNKSAIYNSDGAINYLRGKIGTAIKSGIRIVVADNANCGLCGAGTSSIGIRASGDIVPCLSMVSWNDEPFIIGNVLDSGLLSLWRTGFDKYRFHSFRCCKDHCGNRTMVPSVEPIEFNIEKIPNAKEREPVTPSYPQPWIVQPYRVQRDLTVSTYAVFDSRDYYGKNPSDYNQDTGGKSHEGEE
jgi:radical SAM protein with 4Fe4S-binding SPASM domain